MGEERQPWEVWEPRTLGDAAMRWAAIRGPSRDLARRFRSNSDNRFGKRPLSNWNRRIGTRFLAIGSQNFDPPMMAVKANLDWLDRFCGVWRAEGWFGRENGSEEYSAPVIDALVLGHQEARRARRQLEHLPPMLRATWSYLAILAMPTPIKAVKAVMGSSVARAVTDPLPDTWESGPTVVIGGDRQKPSKLLQKNLGSLLAVALDLPDRVNSKVRPSKPFAKSPPDAQGSIELVTPEGRLVRTVSFEWEPDYTDHTATLLWSTHRAGNPGALIDSHPVYADEAVDPHDVGLTHGLRADLRAAVAKDPQALRAAAIVLDEAGFRCHQLYREIQIRVAYLDDGVFTVFMVARQANGNGASWPLVSMTEAGSYQVIQPARWRRSGATAPKVEWNDEAFAARADGNEVRRLLPPIERSFVLRVLPDGVHYSMPQLTIPTPAPPDPPEILRPPKRPKRPCGLRRLLDRIRGR